MRKFTAKELNILIENKIDFLEAEKTIPEDMPIEYFVGNAEFRGMNFKVNENVLIPRVETEEIIDLALRLETRDTSQQKLTKSRVSCLVSRVFADIGTGSGAIGLSFARELKKRNINFEGYLSDISEKAIEVAKENTMSIMTLEGENCFTYKENSGKLKIIKSDLLKDYPKRLQNKINIIFANLPYIPTSRINNLESSVRNYEPKLALDGGEDGLKIIRELLNQAKDFLAEDGFIILEVNDEHNSAKEFEKEWGIEILKDQFDKNRFWIVKKL